MFQLKQSEEGEKEMAKPMRGAQAQINVGAEPHIEEGGSAAEAGGTRNSLAQATKHLYDEHPIAHDDLGPHHDRDDHVRHSPHVMPNKGHSYG